MALNLKANILQQIRSSQLTSELSVTKEMLSNFVRVASNMIRLVAQFLCQQLIFDEAVIKLKSLKNVSETIPVFLKTPNLITTQHSNPIDRCKIKLNNIQLKLSQFYFIHKLKCGEQLNGVPASERYDTSQETLTWFFCCCCCGLLEQSQCALTQVDDIFQHQQLNNSIKYYSKEIHSICTMFLHTN